MKHLNLLVAGLAASSLLLVSTTARASVAGSPHDFSGESWNLFSGNQTDPGSVCGPCHQPHHADSSKVPLWGHDTSSQNFTMYNTNNVRNSQMVAVPDVQPAGRSLACLSCHDGVTAVNAIGGVIKGGTAVTITNSARIGTDLTHTHPISFTYDALLATKDFGVFNPSATVLTPVNTFGSTFNPAADMTVNGFLLGGNNRMECTSCHDVHNQEGSSYNINNNAHLVKIYGTDAQGRGSLLCRSCHNK
jgi:hypothetical protein